MAHSITAACNGCSACPRQCPTGAITGELKVSYEVDHVTCIDCGVCGMICPLGAVVDEKGQVASRVRRDLRNRPVVDPTLCNGCGMCLEICPFSCRGRVGEQYRGVSYLAAFERCVSCGECSRICIKGAIAMEPADLRAIDPAAVVSALTEILLERK